jgi:hypothetical protein
VFIVVYKELMSKNPSDLKYLATYFDCLGFVLENADYDILDTTWTNEFITSFLVKKMMVSFINPMISTDDEILSKELYENIDTLFKYILRALDNTYQLIHMSYGETPEPRANKRGELMTFLIKNLMRKLNQAIKDPMIVTSLLDTKLFPRIQKLLTNFNKQLYKLYSYNIWTEELVLITASSISIFPCDPKQKIPQKIANNISIQKDFNNHFIKEIIKQKIISTIPKDDKLDLATDEITDQIKIIIKDNFNILFLFKFNTDIFNTILNQNLIQCISTIFNLFRSWYNEEVLFFSNFRNIPRKKSLYTLDILVRFFLYLSTLYNKLQWSSVTNKLTQPLQDINKAITDYSSIISKDIRGLCLNEVVSLFSYNKLVDLKEDQLEKIFTNVRKQVKLFLNDFDVLKLSMECENFILNTLLSSLIDRISEELEKSLKRNPKNSYLNILSEKTTELVNKFMNRYTISETTLNSTRPKYKIMKALFSSLNMNKL